MRLPIAYLIYSSECWFYSEILYVKTSVNWLLQITSGTSISRSIVTVNSYSPSDFKKGSVIPDHLVALKEGFVLSCAIT